MTENGISTHDDAQRSRYMLRALYAARKAQEKIGEKNLLGYYMWSICDNFEWDMGKKPQAFGAYSLNNGVLNPKPKKGMDSFIKATQAWKKPGQANTPHKSQLEAQYTFMQHLFV